MIRYTRVSDILFVQQDGEIALFNPKTSGYYGLEEVASFIWKTLDRPKTLEQIFESVKTEYELVSDDFEGEIRLFLSDMVSESLIIVNDLD